MGQDCSKLCHDIIVFVAYNLWVKASVVGNLSNKCNITQWERSWKRHASRRPSTLLILPLSKLYINNMKIMNIYCGFSSIFVEYLFSGISLLSSSTKLNFIGHKCNFLYNNGIDMQWYTGSTNWCILETVLFITSTNITTNYR